MVFIRLPVGAPGAPAFKQLHLSSILRYQDTVSLQQEHCFVELLGVASLVGDAELISSLFFLVDRLLLFGSRASSFRLAFFPPSSC